MKKKVNCKSFKTEKEAKTWLDKNKVKKTEKLYGIFYIETRKKIILLEKNELKKFTEKKAHKIKVFKDVYELKKWLVDVDDTPNKKYYSIFFPQKNQGLITIDNLPQFDNFTNLIREFTNIYEAINWIERNKKAICYGGYFFLGNIIYFDSGTGRKEGTEVKVTDENGDSMLYLLPELKELITKYETINIGEIKNIYGELFGMYLALKIALQIGIKKIAGDNTGGSFQLE